ncbi:MAG: ATP-binding protein, partial [Bdellovibrionaceae bacterium]|nr:ATP-binding protein [Pseudobdellovibrionaceae bacterium]
GIESPEERKQSNKPPQGRVEIVVERSDSDLLLSLSDDGRGVDLDGVRTKWAKMGVDTASWTEEQLLDSLFSPGFSTKDQATEWSGRGVGLDAVKEAIVQLGGHIKIDTQRGQGTRFSIRLPWIEPHPAWLQNKKSA